MRAFVFPGQGVQRRGMGGDVFERFPVLCGQADTVLGYSIERLCREDPRRLLNRTEYAQPAIYVVNALHHLDASGPDRPVADYLAGHSLGEYNALLAAGCFDFETGLRLVRRRAELMAESDGGGMAAVVGVAPAVIEEALRAGGLANVVIANYNADEQCVLSGTAADLARARPIFEKLDGVRGFVPLRVSGAFHSPLMEPAAAAFRTVLDTVDFDEPRTPVISSVTGRPFAPGGQALRDALAEQITRPIRWDECVRYLRRAGVTDFVEAGESTVLTSLIDKITASEPAGGRPWREYRDEHVLALLRECANGTLGVDEVIDMIRAGGAAAGTG
ncbi:ACP S-malonyltransferase [Nocardia sp. NPDC051030]|uniref:ACP S-malonyltransferase n=1 Tax=Nocardia sp. NPDC051030 TaxID=3155162 RepID=UPI00341FEABC